MLQRCGSVPPEESADEPGSRPLDPQTHGRIERLLGALADLSAARAITVRTVSEVGSPMDLIAATGAGPAARSRIARASADCGVCAEALRSGELRVATTQCSCVNALSSESGADSRVMAVALRHQERTCGVLSLLMDGSATAGELPPGFLQLLPALGDLIGAALENARQTDVDVHSSVMQERHLLANEVHDSLAQNLTSIRMRTSLLRKAVATRDEARATKYLEEIDESLAVAQLRVREIITEFRAQMDAPRLLPALQFAIEELQGASGMQIELDCRVREPRLSPYEEMQIFYIAREALTNALKHSQASCVRLVLDEHAGRYELSVEDNGIGLADGKASDYGHFGLNIMRERAQRVGGLIELKRGEQGGTRVRLTFPSRAANDRAVA
jgi:nitrate/nitrite-specific signal transduction histidine kinase